MITSYTQAMVKGYNVLRVQMKQLNILSMRGTRRLMMAITTTGKQQWASSLRPVPLYQHDFTSLFAEFYADPQLEFCQMLCINETIYCSSHLTNNLTFLFQNCVNLVTQQILIVGKFDFPKDPDYGYGSTLCCSRKSFPSSLSSFFFFFSFDE